VLEKPFTRRDKKLKLAVIFGSEDRSEAGH
jgi:hypothetical protein